LVDNLSPEVSSGNYSGQKIHKNTRADGVIPALIPSTGDVMNSVGVAFFESCFIKKFKSKLGIAFLKAPRQFKLN
jgi:hypothetical protein